MPSILTITDGFISYKICFLIIQTILDLTVQATQNEASRKTFIYLVISNLCFITSVIAMFIHNLRTGRLPDEFNDFVKMINVDDENVRSLRFANFNFNLNNDKSSAKYSISKSWNSLPYNLKSEQPDEFLEELKQYFNISNDEECQVEKCWLCGHD